MESIAENISSEIKALIPRIYGAIAMMVKGSGLDAEDLTQDTLLKAIQHYDSFDGNSNLYTWLYAIARNTTYDALRKVKRRRVYQVDVEAESFSEIIGEDDLTIEKNEKQRLVHLALNNLPTDKKELIIMKDFNELDYKQMAGILDIPEGTVKSRLFKARVMLKNELLKVGYENEQV